eukprot:546790-Hanusia_phi.AAC.1
MEATGGDDLFSVFSLEYKVAFVLPALLPSSLSYFCQLDTPCNAVIGEKSMRKYKRVFNFLWGLKRVEQALSTSWRRASELCHIGTHNVTVRTNLPPPRQLNLSLKVRGADREAHRELQKFALVTSAVETGSCLLLDRPHQLRRKDPRTSAAHRRLRDREEADGSSLQVHPRLLLHPATGSFPRSTPALLSCTQICDFAERKLERHGLMLGPVDARDADHDWREHEEAGEDDEAVMRIPTTLTCKIESKAVEVREEGEGRTVVTA